MEHLGTFYGVGVGPGDPELITRKAVRVLNSCPVIAAPRTKNGEMLALNIAKQAVDMTNKTILPLFFTMERDQSRQNAAHRTAADTIENYLKAGQDVAMLNLGDVSIYATYNYLMEILKDRGYLCEMIPGVPSFCAVAARLGESLTTINAPLHILPAAADLDAALALPGTKVIMKSGKQLPLVTEALRRNGSLKHAAMVQNCGLPGEKVITDLTAVPSPAGYFATIVVKEETCERRNAAAQHI